MKCRSGFVSNSSTCSFFAFGWLIEDSDPIKEMCRKYINESDLKDKDNLLECLDEYGIGEVIHEIPTALEINHNNEYCDEVGIGLCPRSIGDDETGAQFKQRAVDELKKLSLELAEKLGEPYWVQYEYQC